MVEFDHTKTDFLEAIGIPDERGRKILKKVLAIEIESENSSEAFESVMNHFKENLVELSLAMYFHGKASAMIQGEAERMEKTTNMKSGKDFMARYNKFFYAGTGREER